MATSITICGMAWKRSSEELIEKFHTVMEHFDDIDRKKMFGYPCCFVQGNMFTGLHEESWVLRLPEDFRFTVMQTHGALQFEPMAGRVMKEYVKIPLSVQNNVVELKSWIATSLDYAFSLPPKSPKKRKKSSDQKISLI
ncbi:MAG: TfoX/Sxy family protein [Chlamydiales bacterium]|nr:TfoX/Sxy family protein [Chlamydiales bacterium]